MLETFDNQNAGTELGAFNQEKPWLSPAKNTNPIPTYLIVLVGTAIVLALFAVSMGFVSVITTRILEDRIASDTGSSTGGDAAWIASDDDWSEGELEELYFFPAAQLVNFEAIAYIAEKRPDGWTASVYGSLPEETVLPATVALSVPRGAEVIWTGEADDIEDNIRYRRTTVYVEGDYEIHTLELTRYRNMKIDYIMPEDRIVSVSGYPAVETRHRPYTDADMILLMAVIPLDATLISRATYLDYPDEMGKTYFVRAEPALSGSLFSRQFVYSLNGED